jgi:hypothetical protein
MATPLGDLEDDPPPPPPDENDSGRQVRDISRTILKK